MTSHKDMANAIRFLSADAVQKAKSGHPGMPMGMADVATVLFTKYMNFDPKQPKWADRDRFVLSAGHGSMLMYSYLYLTGYEDMTIEEVRNFRQLGAKRQVTRNTVMPQGLKPQPGRWAKALPPLLVWPLPKNCKTHVMAMRWSITLPM